MTTHTPETNQLPTQPQNKGFFNNFLTSSEIREGLREVGSRLSIRGERQSGSLMLAARCEQKPHVEQLLTCAGC